MPTTRRPATRALTLAVLLALLAVATPPASADDAPTFGPHDVRTIFYIAKSENRNRVDFAIRLDERCRPRGDAPVFPYWRMLANTPVTLQGLSFGEPRAYGIASQRVQPPSAEGTWVQIELRALPSRPIEILALENSLGRCDAGARMQIRGVEAHLDHVFVQLHGLISRPEWIEILGRAVSNERSVHERIDD